MPFSLSKSPASFQRLMDVVLKNLTGTECWVYVDDVIEYSKTAQEHASRLEKMLQRFERANLQSQAEKCSLAQSRVQYFGYLYQKTVYLRHLIRWPL